MRACLWDYQGYAHRTRYRLFFPPTLYSFHLEQKTAWPHITVQIFVLVPNILAFCAAAYTESKENTVKFPEISTPVLDKYAQFVSC
jgi:hypothetical protein